MGERLEQVARERVLGLLERERENHRRELYGSMIRAQTDPQGVAAEAKAGEKYYIRLKKVFTDEL